MNLELFDDEQTVSADCPICGTESEPLGLLGTRLHYSCRACGLMYSHEVSE